MGISRGYFQSLKCWTSSSLTYLYIAKIVKPFLEVFQSLDLFILFFFLLYANISKYMIIIFAWTLLRFISNWHKCCITPFSLIVVNRREHRRGRRTAFDDSRDPQEHPLQRTPGEGEVRGPPSLRSPRSSLFA